MSSLPARLLLLSSSVAVLAAGSGCFDLDRTASITPGTVVGSATRPDLDGAPGASFVRVDGIGSSLTRVGDGDGAFRVAGLSAGRLDLRLVDDVDGDGWPDRGRDIAMLLVQDGIAVAGVDLGSLPLGGSFGVRGTALLGGGGTPIASDADHVARVYALRGRCSAVDDVHPFSVDDGACAGSTIERIDRGVEGETAADSLGDWQLTRLVAGPVEVVGLLYARNADGSLGDVVDVAGPVVVDGRAADPGDALRAAEPLLFTEAPLPQIPVELVLNQPAGANAFAVLVAQGTTVPACADLVADDALFADARVALPATDDHAALGDVDVGVYDVVVCAPTGDRRGAATAQLAYPHDDTTRWPVVLLERDPCPLDPAHPDDASRDCDGDDRRGLPLSTFEALRAACAQTCFPAGGAPSASLGAAIADRTCTIDVDGTATTFDCDDDNDGQPDVTEPLACIGPGRGTDLDGDGLCSNVDPFPQCAANDPVLCAAGNENITPQLPGDAVGDVGVVDVLGGTIAGIGALVPATFEHGGTGALIALGVANDAGGLGDDIGVIDVDDNLPVVATSLAWSTLDAEGEPANLSPRLDVSTAGPLVVGGRQQVCLDVPTCNSVEHRFFTDAFAFIVDNDGGDDIFAKRTTSLATPRAAAGLGFSYDDDLDNAFVAGGLGCNDGAATCGSADVVALDSIEHLSLNGTAAAPLTFTTARHGVGIGLVDRGADVLVVVVGGDTAVSGEPEPVADVDTFVFTRATSTFSRASAADAAPPLPAARARFRFDRVVDASGVVRFVVSGGVGDDSTYAVWRVGDATWSTGSLLRSRREHGSTVLPDGRVLILGGAAADAPALSSTELIDPIATEQAARAASLPNGIVTTVRSVPGQPLRSARRRPLVEQLRPGVAVVVGGFGANGAVIDTVESFTTRAINDDAVAPVDTVGARDCVPLRVSNDGRRVLNRCTALSLPGVVDDDPLTPELVVHDVDGGAPRCISCRNGRALGVTGDGTTATATADLGTIVFTSAARFDDTDEDNGAVVDLFTWRAGHVARTLPVDAQIINVSRPFDVVFDGDDVFVVAYFARGNDFVFGRPSALASTIFTANSFHLGDNGAPADDSGAFVVRGVADATAGQGVDNRLLSLSINGAASGLGNTAFGEAPTTAPLLSTNAAFAVAGSIEGALEVYAEAEGYSPTGRACAGGCGAPIAVANDGTILASGDVDGPVLSKPDGSTVVLRDLVGAIALTTIRGLVLATDGSQVSFATDQGVWRVRLPGNDAPTEGQCVRSGNGIAASAAVIDDGIIWLGGDDGVLRSVPLADPAAAPDVVVAADRANPRRTWRNLVVGQGLVVGFDDTEFFNVLSIADDEVLDLDLNVLRDTSGLSIRDVVVVAPDRLELAAFDDTGNTVVIGIDPFAGGGYLSEVRAGDGVVHLLKVGTDARAVATSTAYQLLRMGDDQLLVDYAMPAGTTPVGMVVGPFDDTVWLVRRRSDGADGIFIDRFEPGEATPVTHDRAVVSNPFDVVLVDTLLVVVTFDGILHRYDLTSAAPVDGLPLSTGVNEIVDASIANRGDRGVGVFTTRNDGGDTAVQAIADTCLLQLTP